MTRDQISKQKEDFKKFLEKEYKASETYKSELKWFEGVWSRFKPGLGKDKRGVSGVDKDKLMQIGKKISTYPADFVIPQNFSKNFQTKI